MLTASTQLALQSDVCEGIPPLRLLAVLKGGTRTQCLLDLREPVMLEKFDKSHLFTSHPAITQRAIEDKNLGVYVSMSGARLVHVWCMSGPRLVHVWCMSGPRLVHVWCTSGARLVHVWCTSGARLVHVWSTSGACLVHVWCTSGARLVHVWCTSGPRLVHVWSTSGACLVHVWCMSGARLVHVWCMSGAYPAGGKKPSKPEWFAAFPKSYLRDIWYRMLKELMFAITECGSEWGRPPTWEGY